MPAALPILKGPLRGKRWLLATRSSFFFGSYEPQQSAAFVEAVRPGAVVYDVGAHFGYYTLLASGLTGPTGKVFAFEPSPRNLAKLQTHVELNRCANVQIVEVAISDREGAAQFDNRAGSGVGHLSSEGPLQVRTATLDSLGLPPPQVMKIDVEGAELQALHGGREVITATRPAIFLSVHSQQLERDCLAWLGQLGYRSRPLGTGDFLLTCPR